MFFRKRQDCSQLIIMWLCWAVYTFAYLGRYSYNANINLIINDYGITYAEAGLVVTFFFFAYGIGQVVNGLIVKKYNKKILFPIALFISSLFNLLVFFGVPFYVVKYIWLLNGVVQSCFWPVLISVMSEKLQGEYLNNAISLTSTSAVCGTIFVYGISAFFVKLGHYKFTFLFGAIAMLAVAIFWLFYYKQDERIKEFDKRKEISKTKKSYNTIGLIIIILAIFAVVDNLAKDGLTTWLPAILKENYAVKDESAILFTLLLPCFGILGTLLSVRLYKTIKDFVSLTVLLFSVSAVFLSSFVFLGNHNIIILLLFFGIILCALHAVNSVITAIAPLKLKSNVDSGKIAGILNGFCYLGSTISSYGLGYIADLGGWKSVFLVLFIAILIVAFIGAIYVLYKKSKNNSNL